MAERSVVSRHTTGMMMNPLSAVASSPLFSVACFVWLLWDWGMLLQI